MTDTDATTTDTDPEPLDTTDADDAQLLLADPDDYHRAQRLREIHQARRQVHTAINADGGTDTTDVRNATVLYALEVLPLIHGTDFDTDLPDALPWDSIERYVDAFGTYDGRPTLNYHGFVFQRLNAALAAVRPLIEEDSTDTWEV
jgi:hypothetical protein